MTTYYYGVKRGGRVLNGTNVFDNPQSVDVATSTTVADDIELRVNQLDANSKHITRLDVVKALNAILQLINSNGVGTSTGPGVDLPQPDSSDLG